MEVRNKTFLAYVKSIDTENRRIRFAISSDRVDRHDERVETSAIANSIPGFSKNPCCLACHLHRLADGTPPVIGSWDTDSFKALKHTSEMDLVFATTNLAEQYWNLYSNKHMKAVSIGFRVLDGSYDTAGGKKIFVITKIELFEISCVAIGANREALAKKGLDFQPDDSGIKSILLEAIASEVRPAIEKTVMDVLKDFTDRIADIDEKLEDILNIITPDPDGLAGKMLGPDPDSDRSAGETKSEQVLNTVLQKINESKGVTQNGQD